MIDTTNILEKLNSAKTEKKINGFHLLLHDDNSVIEVSNLTDTATSANTAELSCNHQWYLTNRIESDCQPVICSECGKMACICQLTNGFSNVPFERFPVDSTLKGRTYKAGSYFGDFIYDSFYAPKIKKLKKSKKGAKVIKADFKKS